MIAKISENIADSIAVKEAMLQSPEILNHIAAVIEKIIATYRNGRKLILCGNGGSAADAQHITGELAGKFKMDRRALPAVSLTTNSSSLTAIGNDFGFEQVFARQVESLGIEGDVLIGLSTSGNSRNVLAAVKRAREMGLFTIGLLGGDGGLLKGCVDLALVVPSVDTPRIQECHILIGHIICEHIERELFGHA